MFILVISLAERYLNGFVPHVLWLKYFRLSDTHFVNGRDVTFSYVVFFYIYYFSFSNHNRNSLSNSIDFSPGMMGLIGR